jgi:hypothetical protein
VHAPIPVASHANGALPPEVDDVLARGLAKEPRQRFGSAVELVAELREALDRAAGTTHVAAVAPTRERRRPVPWLPLALGAVLLAGIFAAVVLARDDGGGPEQAAPTAAQTVRETVTLPGTTVVETVTTAPEEEPEPPPETTAEQPPAGNPAELNDQGYALMQDGRYEEALPLLEQSVAGLSGSGELAEAYASYNLAFTRRALGRCDGVLDLLDRSQQIQGDRGEIKRMRRETERACGRDGDD